MGVTSWYGYEWDVDNRIPVRSENDETKSGSDAEDHSSEITAIRAFLNEQNVTYPQLAVSREAETPFRIRGLPTIVVIDKRGIVRNVLIGDAEEVHSVLVSTVDSLLSEETAAPQIVPHVDREQMS